MRYFLPLLIVIFIGCGGGGGGDQKEIPQNNPNKPIAKPINDPYFYQQWHLAKNSNFYSQYFVNDNAHVNGGEYYKYYRGKGIKIAIIDDGLQTNHPDLEGAITKTYNFTTGGTNVSQNGSETHGTSVTGIIGARANKIGIFGIANESEIMFLKYGNGIDSSETIKLFKKAHEFGADIINNSWGTPAGPTDATKDAISYYARNGRDGKGTLIVFATGNDNIRKENDESAIPGVIGVGATNRYNLKASYSNYGNHVDLMAPGANDDFGILTLYPSYLRLNTNLHLFRGTSASAPIVSGALAMLLEVNPNLTRIEVENLIKTTSDKIGSYPYDENGHNMLYGYGKLNITRLLDKAIKN